MTKSGKCLSTMKDAITDNYIDEIFDLFVSQGDAYRPSLFQRVHDIGDMFSYDFMFMIKLDDLSVLKTLIDHGNYQHVYND